MSVSVGIAVELCNKSHSWAYGETKGTKYKGKGLGLKLMYWDQATGQKM